MMRVRNKQQMRKEKKATESYWSQEVPLGLVLVKLQGQQKKQFYHKHLSHCIEQADHLWEVFIQLLQLYVYVQMGKQKNLSLITRL